jgi:hypothetical protein
VSGISPLRAASDRVPGPFAFRILAIDGGGIRGVIPAVLLARLEALLGEALAASREDPAQEAAAARWAGIEAPRIADCFHLIAGTSTGGLLAAGLTATGPDGRPKLTAVDAADLYRARGREIFRRPLLRNILDHFGLLWPKYRLANLRAVLEDPAVFGDALLKDARTDVLITAFDTTVPGPRFFTRWARPGGGAAPETMVEVALATAAAPTYFDPEAIGRSRFIDGGVYAGNPALAAIGMALRRTTDPVPRSVGELFMISLGTGAWSRPLDYGWGGILGWLEPHKGGEALLEAMLGGSADLANEVAHLLLNGDSPPPSTWEPNLPRAEVGGGPQLYRYQPALPEPYALDDVSHLPELTAIADALVQHYEPELQRLAARLIDAGPVPA